MVTSPRAVLPAQPAPGRPSAARYREEISRLRRWSRIVLVVGTFASLGCALGPSWVVRLGLASALGAALVSCLLAWREIGLERRAHASAMLAASRRHGAQLTQERRHTAAVMDAFSRRLQALSLLATSREATIKRLYGEIQRLQGDVNGLRGANSRLTRDRNLRDLTIRELRATVAHLEAQLLAARTAELTQKDDGEVHAFPRRPLRGAVSEDPRSGSIACRDLDFLTAQTVIAMPNYEDDRRFG